MKILKNKDFKEIKWEHLEKMGQVKYQTMSKMIGKRECLRNDQEMPKTSFNHHGRTKQFALHLGNVTANQFHRKISSSLPTITGSYVLQSNTLEVIRKLRKIYV